MADRVLFMSWGETVRGREERALEVFNDAVGLLGRYQQDGKIESFDVVLLSPNGELGGYFQVSGSLEQITALQEADDFQRNTADAVLVADNMKHTIGFANEGIAEQMAIYQEAISKVPQLS